MTPEGVCSVGGDICVSDGNGKRIVTASGGKSGDVILSESLLGKDFSPDIFISVIFY